MYLRVAKYPLIVESSTPKTSSTDKPIAITEKSILENCRLPRARVMTFWYCVNKSGIIIAEAIKTETTVEKIPWYINGALTYQSVAPTNFMIIISFFCE